MTKINSKCLIGYWANFSRAYEIALLGKKSISIYADKDYVTAQEDISYIQSIFSDVTYELDGDIQLEIVKPQNYEPNHRFEGIEDIRERVLKVSSNAKPTEIFSGKKEPIDALLKVATERMNLSLKDIDIIWDLAGIIAQCNKDEFIDTHHIAEAIHYRCCKSDQDSYLPNAAWTDVQVAEFMHGLIRRVTEGTLRSWEPRHFLAVIKEQREKCKPQTTSNE